MVGAAVLVTGSFTAVTVFTLVRDLKPAVTLTHAPGTTPTATIDPEGGAFNFLLVGDDHADGDPKYGVRPQRLNDVTIVIHMYQDHEHAVAVSIPRDLQVAIPACGDHPAQHNKINVTYEYGGLACTAATVENLTGLTVDYAADVDFEGASAISAAIGGVTVCLDGPIDDTHTTPPLHLKAGRVTLSGDEAISFLRTRHSVGDGSDLGRISNQQLFFAALLRQTKSDLGNLPLLYTLSATVARNLTLSANLAHVGTLTRLALAFKGMDLGKVTFVQYPTHYIPDSPNVAADTTAADALVQALRDDRPVRLTGTTSPVGSTALETAGRLQTPTDTPEAKATGLPASRSSNVTLPSAITGQTAAQRTCTVPQK